MDLDWTQESAAGVTLVRVRVRNERATERRVRLRNRLDGPVLPPRRHGTLVAGWDREGVTRVVPAEGAVALGYACPASTADPPVSIESVGPAETGGETDSTPAAAVRKLGDHRPPRAVLGGGGVSREADSGERPIDGRTRELTTDDGGGGREQPPADESLPDGARELLEPARTRIETAEALHATGVVEATALLDANGGLAGVESLSGTLDGDTRELRALARAADALAARAAATTPPTDALRRLS